MSLLYTYLYSIDHYALENHHTIGHTTLLMTLVIADTLLWGSGLVGCCQVMLQLMA